MTKDEYARWLAAYEAMQSEQQKSHIERELMRRDRRWLRRRG